jgi:hypothetical protein
MNGRVINEDTALGHHLLDVAQAQRIGRVSVRRSRVRGGALDNRSQ